MGILRYLKHVTGNTFQLMRKRDCQPASPGRWTSWWREQLSVIALCWTMAQKENTIGKYASENGNAAAFEGSRPRMTSEKPQCDYSRGTTGSVQESHVGCGQTEHVQNASIKFAFYLKTRKRNHFSTYLKPGLRYLPTKVPNSFSRSDGCNSKHVRMISHFDSWTHLGFLPRQFAKHSW